MKVLVIDAIARERVDFLASGGFQVDQIPSALPAAELFARSGGCEAIVTSSSTAVTAELRSTRRGNAIVGVRLDDDVAPEVLDAATKAVDADFSRVIRLAA